jgi:hypothetical protein
MLGSSLRQVAGWSAYVSGAAHLAATATLVGLLAVGEPYRTMNDIALILFAVALVPVAGTLYLLLRPGSPKLAGLGTLVGVAGMFMLAGFSLALLVGVMRFDESSGLYFVANSLIGLWMLVIGFLARGDRSLEPRLAWLTVGAGASQLLYVPAIIVVPVWAIWLGRSLVSRTVPLAVASN